MSLFLDTIALVLFVLRTPPSPTFTAIFGTLCLVTAALLTVWLTYRSFRARRFRRTIAAARARLTAHQALLDHWFRRHHRTDMFSNYMTALSETVDDSGLCDRLCRARQLVILERYDAADRQADNMRLFSPPETRVPHCPECGAAYHFPLVNVWNTGLLRCPNGHITRSSHS